MHVPGPLRLVLAVAGLLAVLGAEGPTAPGPGSPAPSVSASEGSGGVLRYALVEPASIDPAFAAGRPDLTVVRALFEPLTRFRSDGTVAGAAAAGWQVSDDARTFTFTLRPARFHDGSPVRAEHFARAFDRVAGGTADHDPAHPELLADVEGFEAAHLAGVPLEGVTATDERTLRIDLRHPRADLPAILAHPALGPVPPLADTDPGSFGALPVGNGPFRMDEAWDGGGEIRLVRHRAHRSPPALDGVTFVLYAGEDARQRANQDLLDGEVDVALSPRLDVSDDGRGSPPVASPTGQDTPAPTPTPGTRPLRTVGRDVASVYAYGFVTDRAPFDDPVVRRAFSLLIDREEIVPSPREAAVADALVPPGVPGHLGGTCTRCRSDRVRAALLLADRAPPTIRLLVTDDPEAVAAARRVAADVDEAIGVRVRVVSVPVNEYLGVLDAGGAEVFGLRWDLGVRSPDDLLFRWFSSTRLGLTNLTRYHDPEVDELLERARRTVDDEARARLYRRVERRVLDEAVVAPLWYGRATYATADAVRGLRLDPSGRPDLTGVSLEG